MLPRIKFSTKRFKEKLITHRRKSRSWLQSREWEINRSIEEIALASLDRPHTKILGVNIVTSQVTLRRIVDRWRIKTMEIVKIGDIWRKYIDYVITTTNIDLVNISNDHNINLISSHKVGLVTLAPATHPCYFHKN